MGTVADLDLHADAHQGFAPGTPWAAIPADWACPDGAVNDKADFVRVADMMRR